MKITDKTLSAWIDDSLNPEQMTAVSAAVQSDPDLQARADALRAVGAVLREESVEVPVTAERLVSDIRREIRLKEASKSNGFPQWAWVGATACACLVLLALWIPSMREDRVAVFQTEIEYVDSALSGVSPMVYTDHDAGWTVVWLDDVELESGI
jgi:anti-sigma factor RsiW